jgi:Ca-activated chloride channel family protein
MHWGNLSVLNFLWLALALLFFLIWALAVYQKTLHRFAEAQLLSGLVPELNLHLQRIRILLIIGIFVLVVGALSRPQWGFQWQKVKHEAADILLVMDTSKSMLTRDVQPNRLERTKLAVKDLLSKLKGDRVGLIAFAGDAFMVCPLTHDYNGFLLSLNELDTDIIPRGGTNISQAIAEAIKSYDQTPSKYKAIVIMTDGDNLEGDPLALAKKAKDLGIKIYTVGIGTREGELIQIANDQGENEFLKDEQGNYVKSRLNETLLEQIAQTTDGAYVKASGAQFGLETIYENELAVMKKRELEAKMEKRYYERFQIPLALAVLLLVVESCLRPRKRL